MSVFDFEPDYKQDEDEVLDDSNIENEEALEEQEIEEEAASNIKKAGLIIGIIAFVALAIVVVMIIMANVNKADQDDNEVSLASSSEQASTIIDNTSSPELTESTNASVETDIKETDKVKETETEIKETTESETETETEETSEEPQTTGADGRVHRHVSGFLDSESYPEIVSLIKQYYKYVNKGKFSSVNDLLYREKGMDKPVVDESAMAQTMEIIEKYKNFDFFILKGLKAGTYIVYVTCDVKFYNIDTLAPSLSRFIIKTNAKGKLRIYQGEANASEYNYISASEKLNQVRELVDLIDGELRKAKISDAKLHALLEIIR